MALVLVSWNMMYYNNVWPNMRTYMVLFLFIVDHSKCDGYPETYLHVRSCPGL